MGTEGKEPARMVACVVARVALVTGASSGIGAAAAKALARHGFSVAVNYFSGAEGARAVVAEIEAAGGRAVAIQGDVSRVADADRIVFETIAHLGALDVLVNNAGSPVAQKPLAQLDEAEWDRCHAITLKGTWLVSKAAIPHLRGRPGATILNISSAAAHTGGHSGHYAAAKAGVHGLTRALARELAPAITVNCLAPGTIETAFHDKFSTPEHVENNRRLAPMKRAGTAEEVAAWIVFLVDAPFTTGQIYDVNGGLTMPP